MIEEKAGKCGAKQSSSQYVTVNTLRLYNQYN